MHAADNAPREDGGTGRFGDDEVQGWLGVLWGKSAKRAGGVLNLLLSHIFDTAAVAEQIWDHYLSLSARRMLNEVSGGQGCRFFAWLCGVHDYGKATPAFQHVDAFSAEAVLRAGLSWNRHVVDRVRWRHDRAGAYLLRRDLGEACWGEEQIEWVWPLVAGHHGLFPPLREVREPRGGRGELPGRGPAWPRVQKALLSILTAELGYTDLAEVQPARAPTRAEQLQLSGLIVMADWIASDHRHFPGIDDLDRVSLVGARRRARDAWKSLGLRGGWGELPMPDADTFRRRFNETPRPSQVLVQEVAALMGAPGLMVVEAPMGEGKTKAALIAAEVLASRFGLDGVFAGMPTQATSDPVFGKVRDWVARIDPDLSSQVALLHGKRRFNKEWQSLLTSAGNEPDTYFDGIEEDEFGLPDMWADPDEAPERRAPAEWFLGSMRGLLSPFVVGTIDQLLYAATRTKHVMLRMAGLAGKVVILDEVHAADVYMSQFLQEGLRWLGQAKVPVVLLSATLPPAQRRALVAAYLAGATGQEEDEVELPSEPTGYPNVTAVWPEAHRVRSEVRSAETWRKDLYTRIEVLSEPVTAQQERADDTISPGDKAVRALLRERLAEGGCALVIRNTVPRAQATYAALRAEFGDQTRLLHGRLNAGHRADRTEECLDLLGPPDDERVRPDRLIVVATQLAEQSFDVDADLLITDLAPMDLLLQRLGRAHRHAWEVRPPLVKVPRIVVTGFEPRPDGPPALLPASVSIYGEYLLLRTAAMVLQAEGGTWAIPGAVPSLVSRVYGPQAVVPEAWSGAESTARDRWKREQDERQRNAEPFLLTRVGERDKPTLAGLHFGHSRGVSGDEQFQSLVRDGERTIEVVMVKGGERGFHTLAGRRLSINGEVAPDLLDEVLFATVRLPATLTEVAERELSALSGWRDHPWLRYTRALVLDEDACAVLDGHQVQYDDQLGLVVDG
ncbi:CRISPR-associated helicase/endonuclease Cas3 [Actinomadura kijaniata]|uniref:CRISPR-associated helicase/endonuclease Cas3 n=1 Tax=Actinomadura kijaniata TaxID=46161 RepID=UPI000A06FD83|nr:CRISPR-associated helicase/endonuclease Cas3 [Actinomadura kijaniata]